MVVMREIMLLFLSSSWWLSDNELLYDVAHVGEEESGVEYEHISPETAHIL